MNSCSLLNCAELHAAFLEESRTRCRLMNTRTGNPGTSPVSGEILGTRVRGRARNVHDPISDATHYLLMLRKQTVIRYLNESDQQC
jgi:hypothetical protein